jgi:hypothetical protein
MSVKEEKAALQARSAEIKAELEKAERRLEKLSKVQEIDQPDPGTVIRFSRLLAGSPRKYTFVAFRFNADHDSWVLTGRANALRLLGLTEKGNSWEDVLVAIGDAKVYQATKWESLVDDDATEYLYYRSSGMGTLYRVAKGALGHSASEAKSSSTGSWHLSTLTPASWLRDNPGSYRKITAAEAGD